MSIDHDLISVTKRDDGRYNVRYAGEPILVKAAPPQTEFQTKALRILIARHVAELGADERRRYYRRSEKIEI